MRGTARILLLVLACLTGARAAVPNRDAVAAYPEEQTVQQTERNTPEPGWWSGASGRQHFDRHYLQPFGHLPEQDNVLQRGGNTWRTLHNGALASITGWLIVLTVVGLALVWRIFGPARTPPASGRDILRFDIWQRTVHWSTAIAFVLLALSGLVILFGKALILPWLGHEAFSWVAQFSKWVHNICGPIFIVCSVVMFFTFVRRNFMRRSDWHWLRTLGGKIGNKLAPSGYFNGGEKAWFWLGVLGLGLLMSLTGLVLDFPYWSGGGSTRYVQQAADVLHLLGAALYIAATLGHIYLGTIGVPGTYRGMREGVVDEAWAAEHHRIWLEEEVHAGTLQRGAVERRVVPRGAA